MDIGPRITTMMEELNYEQKQAFELIDDNRRHQCLIKMEKIATHDVPTMHNLPVTIHWYVIEHDVVDIPRYLIIDDDLFLKFYIMPWLPHSCYFSTNAACYFGSQNPSERQI